MFFLENIRKHEIIYTMVAIIITKATKKHQNKNQSAQ